MDTKHFIERLGNPSRKAGNVALRFALYSVLYKSLIPVQVIAHIMGMTRDSIYKGIYRHRKLMEIGDKQAIAAQQEVEAHSIRVKPTLAEVNDCYVKMHGVVMSIDNVIY